MSFTRRYINKVTMETLDKSRDVHDPDSWSALGAVLCILLAFFIFATCAFLGVI